MQQDKSIENVVDETNAVNESNTANNANAENRKNDYKVNVIQILMDKVKHR